jgi:hypothetical protein
MTKEVTALYELVLRSGRPVCEQKKLLNEVRKLLPAEGNRWNFRYVIFTLALVALSVPVVAGVLLCRGKEIDLPEGLLALASTAVGALAAFVSQAVHKRDTDEPGPSGGPAGAEHLVVPPQS